MLRPSLTLEVLAHELGQLGAALDAAGTKPEDVFLTAASPGIASLFIPNEYYGSHVVYLFAIAAAIKPQLPAGATDYNSALSAAARDGRLEMTLWLLTNGATNVNAPDGFRKTPLKIALEKGFSDVAALLREHGGREGL